MGKSKKPTINFRVIPEHKRVLQEFAAEIIKTKPYWKEADVWKELMGITDEGVITNEMRRRLRERLRDSERPLLPPESDQIMHDDGRPPRPLDIPSRQYPKPVEPEDEEEDERFLEFDELKTASKR